MQSGGHGAAGLDVLSHQIASGVGNVDQGPAGQRTGVKTVAEEITT